MNNNTLAILFDNRYIKYIFEDMGNNNFRVAIYDSDNEYIDDWYIENLEELTNLTKAIYNLETKGLTAMVSEIAECFGKKLSFNVDENKLRHLKKTYGEEYVNRVKNIAIITLE